MTFKFRQVEGFLTTWLSIIIVQGWSSVPLFTWFNQRWRLIHSNSHHHASDFYSQRSPNKYFLLWDDPSVFSNYLPTREICTLKTRLPATSFGSGNSFCLLMVAYWIILSSDLHGVLTSALDTIATHLGVVRENLSIKANHSGRFFDPASIRQVLLIVNVRSIRMSCIPNCYGLLSLITSFEIIVNQTIRCSVDHPRKQVFPPAQSPAGEKLRFTVWSGSTSLERRDINPT